jgi:hypothetical protein
LLLTIARSLGSGEWDRLFYDRHIYFFDYYSLQLPLHPVWINLVKDPISRIVLEYQRSREFCQSSPQYFVKKDLLNETLDQCVAHRSPRECISVASGVSRMLPFFCGLKNPMRCQDENDWALQQAKENMEFYYTVVGFAEDFYKFLYVLGEWIVRWPFGVILFFLEKLLLQDFKLARLIFMNQWDPRKLADDRGINVTAPDPRTAEILRPLLRFEYQLYDFVKQRFFEQYHILVELDNWECSKKKEFCTETSTRVYDVSLRIHNRTSPKQQEMLLHTDDNVSRARPQSLESSDAAFEEKPNLAVFRKDNFPRVSLRVEQRSSSVLVW